MLATSSMFNVRKSSLKIYSSSASSVKQEASMLATVDFSGAKVEISVRHFELKANLSRL